MSSSSSNQSWRWIGALLLILLLIVLWMMGMGPKQAGCCGDVAALAPAAAPVAAAPVAAPASAVAAAKVYAAWDNGKVTLRGEVASEAEKKKLLDAAAAAYGAGNVIDQLTVSANVGALGSVTLTGTVPSDAEKTSRGDAAIKAFAPASVDNQLAVLAPVAAATQAPDCGKAMQLQVEFATGSATITPYGKRYLDAVVKCVTAPMEVGGHTDSVGSEATNAKLSTARANAVKAYLESQGVKADLLSAQGYASSKPVGDNATAQGRAKNRRIELTTKLATK
jgi:OmpA-OmpF porin, OOP family